MVRLRIKVHRKGFTAKRKGKRYHVKPTTYLRKAKGKCPYCRQPVFAKGVRRKGRIYHKSCAWVVHARIPRRKPPRVRRWLKRRGYL